MGLEYYDPTGAYRANYRPDSSAIRGGKIHGLTVDRSGRIWVGYSGQGIDYFDWPPTGGGLTPSFVQVVGSPVDVQGLVAHGDTIWALTTSELVAYKRATGARIVSYAIPAGPETPVNPLAVAATAGMGRDGNGIRVVRPTAATKTSTSRIRRWRWMMPPSG